MNKEVFSEVTNKQACEWMEGNQAVPLCFLQNTYMKAGYWYSLFKERKTCAVL